MTAAAITQLEPWLSKAELASHLGISVRFIEYRMAEGLPFARIAGKIKFKASQAEVWLEEHGHIERT